MLFITDFADQALILPLVVAVATALLLQGWRRGAVVWVLAVVGTFAAMLALKLVFLACPVRSVVGDIRTPSGHVAAATIVVGGLAALLVRRWAIVLACALVAAMVIAATRLALGLHSPPEALLGLAVGFVGIWVMRRLAGPPPPDLNARRIVAIATAVALVFHGLHLPAEAQIRATAFRFARILAVCQSDEVRLYTSSMRTISSSPR